MFICNAVMTIDKSWTTISNRNSDAFLDGLFAFIKHCEPLLHPITRKIRCPCSRCCNRDDNFVTLKTLEVTPPHICHGLPTFIPLGISRDLTLRNLPPVPHSPEHIDMDAFFEDISANNVPTPPTQTTGPQPAQTTEDNLKMPNCPICKASRWKDPKKTKGKKVANKVSKERRGPLIKELQELWKGVWTKDAATGYYACPTCNEDTPSLAVKNKIVYVGYRRFLRTQHPLRSKFKEFYGFPEHNPKPRKFTEMDIQLQISKVFKRFPGKHPDIAKKNPKPNRQIELNWSKRSIFWDLEYWPFLLLKNNLDVMHIEKNALEALLNTLLQNDKSKDTLKARQDLETLRVRKELWLVKKPNGKFEKPHPKYSFTAENRKRFCKFIKGVRLPDGFGSNFKQKVTADDNNITGMKSHDCHIMMHRLLPYGVQRYLPKNIAAPIIELCLFFKQLCARTLMQQDMAKAKKQSISIMIELEKIFPPAFFDIMIHVAIHLPDEAILGGPLRYRWMFPFERYMKKLKNYVRNKAKPEGSIAEGYVAEEALTFCSRYLKDDVETRFNRLGRNDDGLPEEEPDKFEVFRSVCKPTGRMKESRLTTDVMQAVVWFVLNNSPEVDADILAYKEESPDNVETSFPAWFNYKIREKKVRDGCSEELFSLACGPTSACTYPACIVNGVKFVVHERDILHTTQCSGVSTQSLFSMILQMPFRGYTISGYAFSIKHMLWHLGIFQGINYGIFPSHNNSN
ncbi:hypothetical protein Tco_0116636 [Tanacetum coccineum]